MEAYRNWLALKQVPGVGNVLYKRLIETFKEPGAVFEAGEKRLRGVEGLSEKVSQEIVSFKAFDEIDQELNRMTKVGATLLTLNDPAYPPLLSGIYDPPPFLYVKGVWGESCAPYPIAVVGSRKTTAYGKTMTERLSRGLVEQGCTIVSGFARGIDAIAHRAALAAGGDTIAVLGCGIDQVYPREHKKLYDEMIEKGTIFSEFKIGAPPEAHNFPKRNRIISGLSLGCLVVEANLKSGSLITARLALEQGREVFALPGTVLSETSHGPHQLIASGAKLVEKTEDILEELLPQLKRTSPTEQSPPPELEGEEAYLYSNLAFEPKHIDDLIQESKSAAPAISGLLLCLELKGLVRQMPGQYYVKV